MTSHLAKIALAGVLVVGLPLLIVQAQSGKEVVVPEVEAVVEETPAVEETPVETPPVVEETTPAEEVAPTTDTAVEAPVPEGEVQGATTEQASSTEPSTLLAPVETAPLVAPLALDVASSSATSTPPEPPVEEPKEDPLVLQPEVSLQKEGSSLQANVKMENLTCKNCDKSISEATVVIYYTPWYPNDGPDDKEVGEHFGEQTSTTASIAAGRSETFTWSAANLPPGRYYFVVVVDPENTLGAYRMQRTEVVVD